MSAHGQVNTHDAWWLRESFYLPTCPALPAHEDFLLLNHLILRCVFPPTSQPISQDSQGCDYSASQESQNQISTRALYNSGACVALAAVCPGSGRYGVGMTREKVRNYISKRAGEHEGEQRLPTATPAWACLWKQK